MACSYSGLEILLSCGSDLPLRSSFILPADGERERDKRIVQELLMGQASK